MWHPNCKTLFKTVSKVPFYVHIFHLAAGIAGDLCGHGCVLIFFFPRACEDLLVHVSDLANPRAPPMLLPLFFPLLPVSESVICTPVSHQIFSCWCTNKLMLDLLVTIKWNFTTNGGNVEHKSHAGMCRAVFCIFIQRSSPTVLSEAYFQVNVCRMYFRSEYSALNQLSRITMQLVIKPAGLKDIATAILVSYQLKISKEHDWIITPHLMLLL